MNHETYKPSPETLSRIDFAALELFRDQEKFKKFIEFERNYSDQGIAQLIRDRGAGEVAYNTQVLSGITERCSHLIDVRRAHETYGNIIDDRLRYLVTTLDFQTGDTTEWHLYKQGSEYFDGLRLLLSHHPVHEVDDSEPIFTDHQSIEEFISAKGIYRLNRLQQAATAIKLEMPRSGRSVLSWGVGSVPETFIDMFSLRSQLNLLHLAQQSGQLSSVPQNTLISDYLRKAA